MLVFEQIIQQIYSINVYIVCLLIIKTNFLEIKLISTGKGGDISVQKAWINQMQIIRRELRKYHIQ